MIDSFSKGKEFDYPSYIGYFASKGWYIYVQVEITNTNPIIIGDMVTENQSIQI